MKKFFSLVLALVMALSLTTVAWGADVTTADGLQNAFAAGGDVVLGDDIIATSTLTVPAGKTVTLDLNGHTISMVWTTLITDNHSLIVNKGNLTIMDSSNPSTGKLSYKYDGPTSTWKAATTISNQPGGTLTIKGGTIESLSLSTNSNGDSTKVYKFTIDNLTNGNGGDAVLNIEGGTITAAKGGSIRGFANSTTCENIINITDGSMTGQVWMQDPNADANKGDLNITGGTISANQEGVDAVLFEGDTDASGFDVSIGGDVVVNGSTYLTSLNTTETYTAEITGGTFNGSVTVDTMSGTYDNPGTVTPIAAITGGTFADDSAEEYLADGATVTIDGDTVVKNTDGTVVENPVAEIKGIQYETLADAVAAAPAGGTVTLLADSDEDVTVNKALTFDFNGYTYSGVITPGDKYTYMDGVVKKTPAASGTTSTGNINTTTVTATKAKMYRLATAGGSMKELSNVTEIGKTTVAGKLVNDVPVYVPDIYKVDGVFYVEVAKAYATFALKNNGVYTYLVSAGTASNVDEVIAKFATAVVLDEYVAAAATVECGDAVKGTKGAAIYKSGTDAYYADGSNWAYYNGEFVKYDKNTRVAYKAHTWDAKSIIVKATDVKGVKVPVSIECEDCEKTFSIVPSSKFDNTWVKGVNYTTDDAVDKYNTATVKYYIVLNNATYTGTYVPSVPSTDKVVQSAETFDAGIAMYVGMSVLAATGSVVVFKKRED